MKGVRPAGREDEFELAATQKALARSEELLDGWRREAQRLERELIDGEEKLAEAEARAERLGDALASIRAGRAYQLMRVLWRARRPFTKRRE
jgi:hypothetical protein